MIDECIFKTLLKTIFCTWSRFRMQGFIVCLWFSYQKYTLFSLLSLKARTHGGTAYGACSTGVNIKRRGFHSSGGHERYTRKCVTGLAVGARSGSIILRTLSTTYKLYHNIMYTNMLIITHIVQRCSPAGINNC